MPKRQKNTYNRGTPVNPRNGKKIRKQPQKFEDLFMKNDEESPNVSVMMGEKLEEHRNEIPSPVFHINDTFDNILAKDVTSASKYELKDGSWMKDLSSTTSEESSLENNFPTFLSQKSKPKRQMRVKQSVLKLSTSEDENFAPECSVENPVFKTPYAVEHMTSTPAHRLSKEPFTHLNLSPFIDNEQVHPGEELNSSITMMDMDRSSLNHIKKVTGKKASLLDVEQSKALPSYNINADDSSIQSEPKNVTLSLQCKAGKGWKRHIRKTLHKSTRLSATQQEPPTHIEDSIVFNTSLHTLSLMMCQSSLPVESTRIVFEEPDKCILNLCEQKDLLPVTKYFSDCIKKGGKKIGEGAYGEVFLVPQKKKGVVPSVVKMIPIEGDFTVNDEPQKSYEEIISELIVSRELNELRASKGANSCPNFAFLLQSKCLKGAYTPDLLQLWDIYDQKKGSENERPDIFPDEQIFLMLEYEHAGQDLETCTLLNARQGLSIFLQVAYAIAVSEQQLQFEHRDLHWGNILVSKISETTFEYSLNGTKMSLDTEGCKATIIDFTMSRLIQGSKIYFNDLSEDPSLFVSEGDYQFEIYRKMKSITNDDWKSFHPKTNVYWLHYLVLKMTDECSYKNKRSKLHSIALAELNNIQKIILEYDSALHFVTEYNT